MEKVRKPRIKIYSTTGIIPKYETDGAAGMDIRTNFHNIGDVQFFEGNGRLMEDGNLLVSPGARFMLPTGLFLEMPKNIECQVRSRSGLSLKQGLQVVQAPGTIDSDYRGECKVCLVNLSSQWQIIEKNGRVAQWVFAKVSHPVIDVFESVKQFSETSRGAGGFGHSGNK